MHRTAVASVVLAALLVFGCDTLNDAVPPVSVSGGVFGLNGSTGAEMTGTFAAGKRAAPAATATFTLSETFDDAEAGDFAEIDELVTQLGVAVQTGDVALRLVDTGGGSWPSTVTATGWRLDFEIRDAHGSIAEPYDLVSGATVTFSRSPSCTDAAAECPYAVTGGDVDRLKELFPIEVTGDDDPAYLEELADIVFDSDGSNTPNTLDLTLVVQVTNPTSDFAGLEALIRIGEFETQVRPVIF